MARRQSSKQPKRPADRPSRGTAEEAATDRARPWLLAGTVALYVARPLFPSEGTAEQGDGLPAVMLWLALAVLWMLAAIGQRRFRLRFGRVDTAAGLLLGCIVVSSVWAAVRVTPRPAINMLWQWLALVLGFFLARQFLVSRREARAVVAVMIALAVGLSTYGLYQYGYEMPQTRAEYRADPDRALRQAGMWFPPGSPGRRQFEDRLASTEPLATFALTNSLAGLLAPWLVVLAGVAIGGQRKREAAEDDSSRRTDFLRWLPVAACGLTIGACLVLTKSRTAYLATALGLGLLVLLACRQRLRFGWKLPTAVAVLLALVAAGAVAGGGLDLPVLSEAPKSLLYRLEYWQSTARIIADHPLLGCGPGNFQGTYTAYKLPQASEEVADPHNFLLEVWATAGTPALLALLAVLVLFFRQTRLLEEGDGARKGDRANLCEAPSGPLRKIGPIPVSLPVSLDATWHVYAGAAAGFVLSVPLGQMTAAPPLLAAVGVALPAAAVAAALLVPWVRGGQLPTLLPAVGVAVLLVHLLASGGISFPGVAGTLWLLAALGLRNQGCRHASWNVAAAGLVVVVALAAACYATAYGPVVRSQGKIRSAQLALEDGKFDRAEQLLEAAANDDAWAAEPRQQLSAIALARWKQTGDSAALAHFEGRVAAWLRLQPLGASAWQAAGEWYLEVFSRTRQPEHAEQAVALLRRAVALYPNSPIGRARLSMALQSAAQPTEARREAEEALRLDELTPHADKKLPPELRRRLAER